MPREYGVMYILAVVAEKTEQESQTHTTTGTPQSSTKAIMILVKTKLTHSRLLFDPHCESKWRP